MIRTTTSPSLLAGLLMSLTVSATLSVPVSAAPWVDPGDETLRHHLQVLADAGVLSVPITTYPLMWSGIAKDLDRVPEAALSELHYWSLSYVRHELSRQTEMFVMDTRAGIATDTPLMNDFGSDQREQNEVEVNGNWLFDYFSVNLDFTFASDEIDSRQYRFDGSYLAAVLGNWSLSVGAVDRWWGPGWQSSLILSNNARPVPGVALQRNYSDAFETPWLSWIGPWQLVVFGGQLESGRAVPEAKLIGMRVSFKPFHQLELGLSRTAQWGGEGRPESLSSLWDAFIGKDNRGDNGITESNEPGNQLAGFDGRLGFAVGASQLALYGQAIGEDAAGIGPSRYLLLAGAEVAWASAQLHNRIYIEASSTEAKQGDYPDYAYEHGIYKSGYRHRGRAIGASLDNDTLSISLGGLHNLAAGHTMQWKIARVELNRDNSNQVAPGGNPLSDTAVDFTRVELGYKHRLNQKTRIGVQGIYQSQDITWRASRSSLGGETSGSGGMLTIEHKW